MRISWIHSFDDEPILLYSEVDSAMLERRKIEIYKDDSFGLASASFEFGGTSLSSVPLPSVAEIANDPQFISTEITEEEFNEVWGTYMNYLNKE
jgi:Domain of unknown function (DUF6881)